ncbi:MAG: hypothetical protein U0105_26060 [Candidatus Obscuribacterales bacterium]
MQRYFARVVRAIIVSVLGFGGGIGLMTFIAAIVLTGKQQGAIMIGLIAPLTSVPFLRSFSPLCFCCPT